MFIGIHLSDRAARLLKHHSKIKFRRSQAADWFERTETILHSLGSSAVN